MLIGQIFKIDGLDLLVADSRTGEYLLELSQQGAFTGASYPSYHFDYLFISPCI